MQMRVSHDHLPVMVAERSLLNQLSSSMSLRPDVVSIQQTPGIFKFRRRVSNQPPIGTFLLLIIENFRLFQSLSDSDRGNASSLSFSEQERHVQCDADLSISVQCRVLF